jgi:hypothetical protein
LYNIFVLFGLFMKPVRLIKMCRNETYSKVCIGKHLSVMCPIKNCLKQGDALLPLGEMYTRFWWESQKERDY